MTFLSLIMLLGLAALALPILIHLLNRRKPMVVDWGAMRFLQASHQARRRRLLLEDVLLLCLRCLAIALIVLAMARPFMLSQSVIPWALVLPLVLVAIIGLVLALSIVSNRRRSRQLAGLCLGLIAAALLSSLLERWVQAHRWLGQHGGEDIMLVIDASASMTVNRDGQSNFEHALDEARSVAGAMGAGDAIGILLAGPAPRVILAPTSDRKAVQETLASRVCRPTSGAMGALEALNAALSALAEGHNPAKKIILFTDGHSLGWDAHNEARWSYLAQRMKTLPTTPKVICRRFPFPADFENAAVAEISLSRKIVGTDRPVMIDVKILNAGSKPLAPPAVELLADDRLLERKYPGKELPPGGAEDVRFEYRFDTPGHHVLKARIVGEDALPLDNTLERVVNILDTLPVLLVDGAPSERFFRGASAFTRVALMPGDEPAAAKNPADGASTNATDFLVRPKVIAVTALSAYHELDQNKVVILLNVPRLPAPVVQRLGEFVAAGGGLLVAPGRRAEPESCNAWKTSAGQPLLPAALLERRQLPDRPAHFDLRSFKHPALQLVAESPHSDAGSLLVRAYWKLAPAGKETRPQICGLFDNGDPAIVERQIGQGRVILSAIAFDNRDSTLTSLKSFVPFIHELIYYLAAPAVPDVNILPGTDLILDLPSGKTPGRSSGLAAKVEVVTPAQQRRPAIVERAGDHFRIRFTETQEPGLYRVMLPAATAATNAGANAEIPFTVTRQSAESIYKGLSETDVAAVRRNVDLAMVEGKDVLLMAAKGKAPGEEIWKWLAFGALLALLAETALARWISQQRRVAAVPAISLPSDEKRARTGMRARQA